MRDVLKDVVLHHTLIDWSDPTITPDSISRVLLGHADGKSPAYWTDEEFLLGQDDRGNAVYMQPHQIERQILFEAGRTQWGDQGFYGKPNYQHFLMLIRLMFPKTDITPSLADAVMFFCFGVTVGRKILNLIGSQNSSKSASSSRIAYAAMYIDPEYTVAYVANPFDNAADSTVWGDIEELWDELLTAHPHPIRADATALFPKAIKYANKRVEFIPNLPKAGRIELKNVKHVGKYKGQKTRGKESHRGVMFVILDEVNEIENMAFLTTLSNIASQDEFFSITSQNFKDEADMGGRLTEPDATVSEIFGEEYPTNFDELEIDRHACWYSKYHSITLRFDGLRSPNILAGRTIYNYLFKQTDLERIKGTTGEASLDFYSQVRSFPVRGSEVNSVLSSSKVTASRHKDNWYRLTNIQGAVAFCDPAFGGRDKAVWGSAKFGTAMVSDGEGKEYSQELIVFDGQFHALSLVKDAFYNDFWFDQMKELGIDTREFLPGSPVEFEHQIAIQCLKYNKAAGVSASNFGYDYSMRADIGPAMAQIIGYSTVPFDYRGKPEGVYLHSLKRNSDECCKDRLTELAFLAADFFLNKQVRGGGVIDAAITQLSRTQYTTTGGKYLAEDKRTYKARWQQVSPDHRDVLMGIAGMAIKRGFRKQTLTSHESSAENVFARLSSLGIGKSKIGVRLPR